MFDQPLQPSWRTGLAPGDIVAFRFPVVEELHTPPPKIRPCLVLDIQTLGHVDFAVIAYGTSAETAANRGYDIHVTEAQERVVAGLRRPTRFVGSRRIMIALDHPDFVVHGALKTPVIGRLSGRSHHAMKRMWGRIRADQKRREQAMKTYSPPKFSPAPRVSDTLRNRPDSNT